MYLACSSEGPSFFATDLPSPGGLNDGDLDNDLEGVDSRDLLHVTSRSGSSIGGNAVEGMDVPLSSSALPFSPDEEDVENQLMHIDDQLIRLDGSIDNIEQVRHLSPLNFISGELQAREKLNAKQLNFCFYFSSFGHEMGLQ